MSILSLFVLVLSVLSTAREPYVIIFSNPLINKFFRRKLRLAIQNFAKKVTVTRGPRTNRNQVSGRVCPVNLVDVVREFPERENVACQAVKIKKEKKP